MKRHIILLGAVALCAVAAGGCQDNDVRAYLKNDLQPYLANTMFPLLDQVAKATCNLDLDQHPTDHAPYLKMCTGGGGDYTTPPPPPPPTKW